MAGTWYLVGGEGEESADLTADRALVSDASGKVSASSVAAATLGYLSDVTGPVQAQLNGKLNLSGGTMTGALTLSSASPGNDDAVKKSYVDAAIQGLDIKASCRAATTGNLANLSGLQTVDGVQLAAGNRVLVKNQGGAASNAANGIYIAAAGAWARASDFNSPDNVTSGAFTFIEEGTDNKDTGWVLTTDGAINVGATALTFTQFSGAGAFSVAQGTGITVAPSGNSYTVSHAAHTGDVTGATELTIDDGKVTTVKISSNAVTTDKINDGAVTTVKLPNSTGASDGVTMAKIAQGIGVLGQRTATSGAPSYYQPTAASTVLRSTAVGAYEWGKVALTTDVSGTLPISSGGMGQSTAATQGGVVYGISTTALGFSAAGTSGNILVSGGTGAPTWRSAKGATSIRNDIGLGTDSTTLRPIHYLESNAAVGAVAKTISADGGYTASATGDIIAVKFLNGNSAVPTTLAAGGAAINMRFNGAALTAAMIPNIANWVGLFEYDGTNWVLLNPATLGITAGSPISGLTTNAVVYAGSATSVSSLTGLGTSGNVLKSSGTGAPAWGTVDLASTTNVTGTLPLSNGGIGRTTAPTLTVNLDGTANTPSLLPSTGNVSVNATGTLPVSKGGIGLSTIAINSMLYASAANTISALAPSSTANRVLITTTAGGAPSWGQVPVAAISATGISNTAYLRGDGTWATPTATPTFSGLTAGGAMYASSATAIASTAAGNAGDVLISAAASAPVWGKISGYYTSSLAATASTITAPGLRVTAGTIIGILFSGSYSSTSPKTLAAQNSSDTGTKQMYSGSTQLTSNNILTYVSTSQISLWQYDGTRWNLLNPIAAGGGGSGYLPLTGGELTGNSGEKGKLAINLYANDSDRTANALTVKGISSSWTGGSMSYITNSAAVFKNVMCGGSLVGFRYDAPGNLYIGAQSLAQNGNGYGILQATDTGHDGGLYYGALIELHANRPGTSATGNDNRNQEGNMRLAAVGNINIHAISNAANNSSITLSGAVAVQSGSVTVGATNDNTRKIDVLGTNGFRSSIYPNRVSATYNDLTTSLQHNGITFSPMTINSVNDSLTSTTAGAVTWQITTIGNELIIRCYSGGLWYVKARYSTSSPTV